MVDILKNLEIAKESASSAGKLLINSKKDLNFEKNSEGKDIKLKADLEVENLIKKYISSHSSYPILGEETGSSVETLGETFWVVDPLDGTSNFLRGIPISCVSIALIQNMTPILGVIYDFNHHEIYCGHKESKAYMNDKEIRVSSLSLKSESTLVTGIPAKTNYSDTEFSEMIANFQAWKKIRMIGSAAMAACYVASGKAETYQENGIFIWDIAAGVLIIDEAGGKVSDISNFGDEAIDICASNGNIYQKMLEKIKNF